MKILKFWRTELSNAQNKQRGEKERLLGIDTCPSLNDKKEIRCINVTEASRCTMLTVSEFLTLWIISIPYIGSKHVSFKIFIL